MMLSSRLPKSRELNPETARVYPPCRILAQYRRELGLSQSRFVAVAICASLDISTQTKRDFVKWVLSPDSGSVWCDTPMLCRIESGLSAITRQMQEVLDRVADHFRHPISDRHELRQARESLNVSQSRFAVICLIEMSEIGQADKERMISQMIRYSYQCPFAGGYSTVCNVEIGMDKKLSDGGMIAFLNGINLAREVAGLPLVSLGELFADYLAEVDGWA